MPDNADTRHAGLMLFSRGADAECCRLAAVLVVPEDDAPPVLRPMGGEETTPERLTVVAGDAVWRWRFELPARGGAYYTVGDDRYPVAADLSGDVRIAYVSCNGQEHNDADRDLAERNVLWQRLAEQHAGCPYHLMLHGGDQLYADDILQCHPEIERWSRVPNAARGSLPFSPDMREAAERFLFTRYRDLSRQPQTSWLSARVPSLMMWDDHDIIDGWGSRAEVILDSPVGRGIFTVAERMFRLFQLGMAGEGVPEIGLDPEAPHHNLAARFPGFSIIAPDLRSERRPSRIMSEAGWSELERALTAAADQPRIFLMSSVPALGPRLSWVERFLHILPHMQKYEDDLRDQWQSRSHREEWRRLLQLLERIATGSTEITALSGEIHLATRGEMELPDGPPIHQLVASGISHPPPPNAYARALGALARLGEAPLPGRPIRLMPLPGQRGVYTNERNYLVVTRENGAWHAAWELEDSGKTPSLQI